MKKISIIIRYLTLIMMPLFIVSCGGSSSSDDSSSDDSSLDDSSLDASLADTSLSGLTFDEGKLDQAFQSIQKSYTASVGYLTTTLTLRPVAHNSAASITVNGDSIASGSDSAQVSLAKGDNTVTVMVTAEDGQTTQTYILDVSRAGMAEFAQQAYLKASNAEGGDKFGNSVALDGDTLVVGAYLEDSSADGGESDNEAERAGAVYVFTRVDSSWRQQAFLKASNAEANDFFGSSVALDGDTLVVGALYEDSSADGGETDNSAIDSGAVYVFTRVDGSWRQQAFLKASNAGANDLFGYSAALDGDTLVVAAPGEDSSANDGESNNEAANSGAVYVFTRVDGSWSQQPFLKASNAEANDFFGYSVALDGDTLVVCATFEDSSADGGESDNEAAKAGAVYVFTRVDSIWRQQAFLKASNAEANDFFGRSVALDGDTLVVSAVLEDSSANDGESNNEAKTAGAVYVFTRVDSSWSQQALLKASNAESYDHFGYSVALDGDTLVVGAFREDSSTDSGETDNSAIDSGAVYVFTRVDSSWRQQALLKASNAESNDEFGSSVAVDGATVVVGALSEDSAAGAVYIW
jgi:hypothetical protein